LRVDGVDKVDKVDKVDEVDRVYGGMLPFGGRK
jgi:hypothetical protein